MKYAELETILGDVERARAIYELAISQPRLDMPEMLWKGYIDFEIEQQEYNNVRALYRRLLQRTQHVKVWLSYAKFELSIDSPTCVVQSRDVYKQAHKALQRSLEKEERLMLLEAWKAFEFEEGDDKSQRYVESQMPKRVKKRRRLVTEDGTETGWEEYYDYIFPSDEAAQPGLKLLSIAKMWKKEQAVEQVDEQTEEGMDQDEES
jgi:crooked neck